MLQVIERVGTFGGICVCSVCKDEYEIKSIYDARKVSVGDLCLKCKTAVSNMGEITQSNLQAVFNYEPKTGKLTYRNNSLNGMGGDNATFLSDQGYLLTRINGIVYLAHRIIYVYMTGHFPKQIDHINHIRDDNRWENLRDVTNKINHLNTSLSKNSTTKVNGVALHKPTGKYRAYIMVDKKQIHLGLFHTLEEASLARKEADLKYNFHENHGK